MISKFTHRRQHSGAVNLATSNIMPHTTMYAPRPVLLLFSVVSAIPICTAGPFAASDRLIFGLQAAFGLENNIPRNISHIKMLYSQPQVGIIVWDSPESRLPIKRFEIVSEGVVGGAIHPGGHLFGDTLMLGSFRFSICLPGRCIQVWIKRRRNSAGISSSYRKQGPAYSAV